MTVVATLVPASPAAAQSPSADSVANAEAVIAAALSGDAASLQSYWAGALPRLSDAAVREPAGGVFPYQPGEVPAIACAVTAEVAAGNAFYCPDDESISYDVAFVAGLYERWGPAGPLLTIAHEYGHHIQNLVGAPELSKPRELQADCYAGMYLGFLRDEDVLTAEDVGAAITAAWAAGDAVGTPWMDPGVHGEPRERRQAAGIGWGTGEGAYCSAYADWQDAAPVPLFDDTLLRLEPFADPVPEEDGSLLIQLPDAVLLVWRDTFDVATPAMDQIAGVLTQVLPETTDWTLGDPSDGWLERQRPGTGSGSWLTFAGVGPDGSASGGAAGLQVDPSGIGQLWIAWGTDPDHPDVASAQGIGALLAMAWGYCDPDAEVTDNCAPDALPGSPSPAP
ncbi:MAG: neutral zinc metallopeptidase [Chloroflexota bacterium]